MKLIRIKLITINIIKIKINNFYNSEEEGGDGNDKNSSALSISMVKNRKSREPFSSEDEAWRSYLENPSMGLTIAASDEVITLLLMSIRIFVGEFNLIPDNVGTHYSYP